MQFQIEPDSGQACLRRDAHSRRERFLNLREILVPDATYRSLATLYSANQLHHVDVRRHGDVSQSSPVSGLGLLP